MLYSQSPPLADNDTAPESAPRFARDSEDRGEPQFGRRSMPPIQILPPPRPSLVRRIFRAVTRFVILVGIGVGVTLGWQAYGDMARQMFAANVPEYAWLLAYLPSTRPPAAVAVAASPALQLEPLASSVELVRRGVEQLALKQEQMNRNIAALQAADEDIKQRISQPAPAAPIPAQPVAVAPPPKPAPPPKLQASPSAQTAPRPAASAAPVSILPR
ncbi:MAG: hypothetical protein U1E61_09540 [Bradyrhizobium sp.]